MEVRHDSYCGLNCGACPVGMANQQDDREAILRMSEEWGVPEQELLCSGCKGDVTAGYCRNCSMRACAREKGLEFCHECDQFPCSEITDFRNDDAPHHSTVLDNLERIKRISVKAWLTEQDKRWSCPECGRRFSWYQENCAGCGAELYSCLKEEEQLRF